MLVGSREYWRERTSYPTDWEARAVMATEFIRPRWTVLDLGCGPHMALRRHLPEDCKYVPADLYRWTPDVLDVDVDGNLFPSGRFDCVILLGVLEYLDKPENAFRFASVSAAAMIVSYCHPLTANQVSRKEIGWVSAFSPDQLLYLAADSGWGLARESTFSRSEQTHQIIYALAPT